MRGEGDSRLSGGELELIAHARAAETQAQQGSVRGEAAAGFERIQPLLRLDLAVGHAHVHPVHAHRSAQRCEIRHGIGAAGGRNAKSQIQQLIPDPGSRTMVAEAGDLHVIHFPQRDVDGKLVRQGLVRLGQGLRVLVEGMHVTHQGAAGVGDIRHVRIHRIQARCGGVGIAGVARQDDAARDVEQSQVAPVARVVLLTMDHDGVRP